MRAHNLLILLCIAVAITACEKDAATQVTSQKLQGSYRGRVVAGSAGNYAVINGAITLQVSGPNFKAETNSHNPLPSLGTFAINNNQVAFADSLVYPAIYTLSNMLAGNFSTQIKGDSLILVKDDGSYSYRFKKL